jgi:hypothetical protein
MRQLFFFLLIGICLSILFSSGQIENPDTQLRLTQARIIVNEQKFGLPNDVGEELHGNIAINKLGERFMVYNPGQTITFIPIYFTVKHFISDEVKVYYLSAFLVSFMNYLVHALCGFLLFKISLNFGVPKLNAYLASLFFLLTSYSFVFAQSTYEHHYEMFFILSSTLFSLKKNCKYSGLLSGLMLSIGMIFRTTSILAFPAILLIQKDNYERYKCVLSISIGLIFVFLYNYFRFGSPLETGYNLAWKLAHSNQFEFWSMYRIPQAFFGLLFSPGKGLLFFSTTVVIAFLGLKTLFNQYRKMYYFIILVSSIYLLVFSLNFAWHGSIWSYGPRYILPIIPFLYLPIIFIRPKKWLFITLFLTFFIQIELIAVNYKRDVLSDFISYNGISDTEYLFSLSKEPHVVQAKQFLIIFNKNFGQLNNFMPNSPWKKETRTASILQDLNRSIEINSINFWWIRIFHYNASMKIIIFSILLFSSAVIISFLLFNYVKRELL